MIIFSFSVYMISFPWSLQICHADINSWVIAFPRNYTGKNLFESICHLALRPLRLLSKLPNQTRQRQTYFCLLIFMIKSSEDSSNKPAGWGNHSWFYIVVRISFFLWVSHF